MHKTQATLETEPSFHFWQMLNSLLREDDTPEAVEDAKVRYQWLAANISKCQQVIRDVQERTIFDILWKLAQETQAMPGYIPLRQTIEGMQQSAGVEAWLEEFDDNRSAFTRHPVPDLPHLLKNLETEAARQSVDHITRVAGRINGTGWEEPKTKKKLHGPADAVNWLMRQLDKERPIIFSDAEGSGMWHENTAAIVEALNKHATGATIQTLIRGMDDNWNLKLGKTLLIAGTSGDGKSTLMLSMLYNFALQGHNVILFTLEDPQIDVWVKLAFIHTARFREEFELPSLFEWERRAALESAGRNSSQWLTPEERANMRDVIASVKARDRVPGLIDVQPINEWSKMKGYVSARMAENQYSIMAVDYFSERMATPGSDPRFREREINSAAVEAMDFAKANNMLLIAPVQVKKNLRDAYAAEFVDADPAKNSGFVAPYDDIAAVKADKYPGLPEGTDYCIGVWSGPDLKNKNQGLICCMKYRPTVQFPCFRFKLEPNSKYVRDAGRSVVDRSIALATVKHDWSEEM